jgi:hypothetical protein
MDVLAPGDGEIMGGSEREEAALARGNAHDRRAKVH